jgi:hypothetical protein
MEVEEADFMARFWAAYDQAKLLMIQAFPPDGEYHG